MVLTNINAMSEEQIKQKAEDYINENTQGVVIDSNICNFLLDVYLAGAHSRDEEIEKLQENVEAMESYIEAEKACMQGEIDEMREQLKMNAENFQKLCNRHPWVSVDDKLPDPHTPVYAKNNNSKWFFALRTGNRVRPWYNIVERYSTEVTHWSPIPELKKE